jgi:hypothetical protein
MANLHLIEPVAQSRRNASTGPVVLIGADQDPLDVGETECRLAGPGRTSRHHVRAVGAEQPDLLRAGVPQTLGVTAPSELSIDLSGALVRPRHPRLKVPEARSNRQGERLGVRFPDASQHTNRNPDLLG